MKHWWIPLACIILILAGVCFFGVGFSNNRNEKIETALWILSEKSYFEGQKEAISGDVRIKKTETGWIWVKSPWDTGRAPVYNPSADPALK